MAITRDIVKKKTVIIQVFNLGTSTTKNDSL